MAPKYLEVLPKTLEAISRQNISDHLIIPLSVQFCCILNCVFFVFFSHFLSQIKIKNGHATLIFFSVFVQCNMLHGKKMEKKISVAPALLYFTD